MCRPRVRRRQGLTTQTANPSKAGKRLGRHRLFHRASPELRGWVLGEKEIIALSSLFVRVLMYAGFATWEVAEWIFKKN
jgi:hypothetical protein